MHQCPIFERMLVDDGIILVKYWFSVSDEVQEKRFKARIDDPLKPWKLSPMDLEARSRWVDYSRAKDEMFVHTDIPEAPWHVVESDIKRNARINCISHLLSPGPVRAARRGEDQAPEAPGRHRLRAPAARHLHLRSRRVGASSWMQSTARPGARRVGGTMGTDRHSAEPEDLPPLELRRVRDLDLAEATRDGAAPPPQRGLRDRAPRQLRLRDRRRRALSRGVRPLGLGSRGRCTGCSRASSPATRTSARRREARPRGAHRASAVRRSSPRRDSRARLGLGRAPRPRLLLGARARRRAARRPARRSSSGRSTSACAARSARSTSRAPRSSASGCGSSIAETTTAGNAVAEVEVSAR